MANPTASPNVESFAHITIKAGAEFDLDCRVRIPRIWFGRPTAALLDIENIDAASHLVDVLLVAITSMRHEQANAKRCDARASGEGYG